MKSKPHDAISASVDPALDDDGSAAIAVTGDGTSRESTEIRGPAERAPTPTTGVLPATPTLPAPAPHDPPSAPQPATSTLRPAWPNVPANPRPIFTGAPTSTPSGFMVTPPSDRSPTSGSRAGAPPGGSAGQRPADTTRSRTPSVTLDLALLRGALEEIPLGVATTRGGQILYANGAFERIYGAPPGGLEQKHVSILFDRAMFERLSKTLDERRVFDGRIRTRGLDGRQIDAEVHVEWYSSEALGIGGFIVVRDISLELSALGRLVDHLGGALFRIRLDDGALEYVSASVQKLTGLEAATCTEHPVLLTKLVSTEERERLLFLYRRVAQGDLLVGTAQVSVKRGDGTTRVLHVRATGRRDTGGAVRHIDGVATDVTHEAQDAGYTHDPRFGRMRQGLGQALARASGPISAGVMELSHELLRESSQQHHTIGREIRAMRSALHRHAHAMPRELFEELAARLTTTAGAVTGASALNRGVRRALDGATIGAPLAEVLDNARATLAPTIGETSMVVDPGPAATDLIEQRVDEITLAVTYLGLRAFRLAGSGELRLDARKVPRAPSPTRLHARHTPEQEDILIEILGTAAPEHDLPSIDISSDMLKTIPRRADADIAFAAVKELLDAVGVVIESDEATLDLARTTLRLRRG